MQIERIRDFEELHGLADAWNALAGGVPFRQWDWYTTWWRHYGDLGQLYVLCLRDARRLVALAPWYLARHPAKGRVVSFLGCGEVCSDYQTVLCLPGAEAKVCQELAVWLTAANHKSDAWDLLEFSGIEASDATMSGLAEQLKEHGNQLATQPALNCWRLELPESWEAYLARLSKSNRSHVRKLERATAGPTEVAWRTVERPDELEAGWHWLVHLHQRRWESRGEPGAFASQRFASFHRDVARRMFGNGQLRLHWLELAGRPAAAEYHFSGDGAIYVYQGGMEPDLLREQPGSLSRIMFIKQALAEGHRAIDFLRGDEIYKAHWRAQPRPCIDLRVIPRRLSSRLRHRAWTAGRSVKRWLVRQNVGADVS